MSAPGAARDTSIRTYRARRDFAVTREPPHGRGGATGPAPIFVVQKHAAHRAGLHWDFRLEHGGVLWSWAVRKGPSLDPRDKRIAAHVEDHPLDYAGFQGAIPAGQYGAGTVETWDHGTWEAVGDPEAGMAKGELTFRLRGARLNGRFHLVRMKPKPRQRGDNWLLFKGHDEAERAGADAAAIEAATAAPPIATSGANEPPVEGARRGRLSGRLSPQLAAPVEEPPEGGDWISEIKFDGYRLLVFLDDGKVRIVTRNGHDWATRLPGLARAAAALGLESALLDGELVALRDDGSSSFSDLQAVLADGREVGLFFYAFDLLHLNGWDLRDGALIERKRVLRQVLAGADAMLLYSDHHQGDTAAMRLEACRLGLEGIVCKRAGAPYRAGRGQGWVKVKCTGREEFVVLGWTPPRGRRTGVGSLHLGYNDQHGALHYAGGVGTGFSDAELARLRRELEVRAAGPPPGLLAAGDKLDQAIRWVRPELVAEVQFVGWSGAGRVRHAVYLGQREDKRADEVVRDVADPDAARGVAAPARPARAGRVVTARAPKRPEARIGGVRLSHPERELWPGITKRDLAEYWQAVAGAALPGIACRPLAIVRCPEGIDGEHFFQKRGRGQLPAQIHEGAAAGSPFLAIEGLEGLLALTQMATIEIHPWGVTEADPLHPDTLVFDLDPGEGVAFPEVVRAAHEVRDRLGGLGLASFCRTTGGKGLHVVVPLAPRAGWDAAKAFCHALAETLSREQPDRYLPTVRKADRKGRILVDWLRNGLGATAVASFCPRARPGATVATPLAWEEVVASLDPGAFTVCTVPKRLTGADPWAGFRAAARDLPEVARERVKPARGRSKRPVVVSAAKPKPRARR